MQNKSTIGFLAKQYKNVLIKCLMVGVFAGTMTFGGAQAATFAPTLDNTETKTYLKELKQADATTPVYTEAEVNAISSAYSIEVVDPSTYYFKTFTLQENNTAVTYGVLLDDYANVRNETDLITTAIISATIPSLQGTTNPYVEIERADSASHTFSIAIDGNAAPLYFAVTDGGAVMKNSGRINNTSGTGHTYSQNFIGNTTNNDGGGMLNDVTAEGGAIEITTLIGDFIGNTSSNGNGGGMRNNTGEEDTIQIGILTGDFVGNMAYAGGGMANEANRSNSTVKITEVIGNFVGNKAAQNSGGGMLNVGFNYGAVEIGTITGDFVGNIAKISGGGMSNGTNYSAPNNTVEITTLTGDFIGNIAGENGGGMANEAYNTNSSVEINTITGDFVSNTASFAGGGMFNMASHNGSIKIGNLTGDFVGNIAKFSGGGMYNNANDLAVTGGKVEIGTIIGDFIGNTASDGGGGGMHNNASGTNNIVKITTLTGDFVGNMASGGLLNGGGGIENSASDSGKIEMGTLTSDFIGNGSSSLAFGGGMYNDANGGAISIENITGKFDGNTAGNGGGLYNFGYNGTVTINNLTTDFINNLASSDMGGGLFNNAAVGGNVKITTLTGDFDGNIAGQGKGGGIYNLANRGTVEIGAIIGDFNANTAGLGGAMYNEAISGGLLTIGSISGSFTNNAAKTNAVGQTALGGAIWTNTSLTFEADAQAYDISGNYTSSDGGSTKDYNAIYLAANNLSLNFYLNNGGSYTLDDNVRTDGMNSYAFNIIGNGSGNNVFNLNNELYNAFSVTVKNAILNIGTGSYDSGSIGNANLTVQGSGALIVDSTNLIMTTTGTVNIEDGSGLSVVSGTLDVTGGTLKVHSNADTFETGASATLKVDGDDFGSFSADGTFVANANIGKKIDNDGHLYLEGVDLGTIEEDVYINLLANIIDVGSSGTVELGTTQVNKAYSLDDILNSSSFDTAVKAGTLASLKNVSVSHLIANGFIVNSTIASGATLTITGSQNTILSEGNITNAGTLNLGTDILDSEFGTIRGDLITSYKTTGLSALKITGKIQTSVGISTFNKNVSANNLNLISGTTTFNADLEVVTTSELDGGTNSFNGTSNFFGDVNNNGGINIFNGDTIFGALYAGSGDATFNGITEFTGAYRNTGTSTINNKATFEKGYDSAGTLNVGDAVTGASGTVTIGDATTMNINAGATLNIINGTVDVSNGNLIVDSGAIFATGVNGELIAKASDFGSFDFNSGSFDFNGNVLKQLNNNGNLVLKGLVPATLSYSNYMSLSKNFASVALTGNGTFEFEGITADTSLLKLRYVEDGTILANNVVLGDRTLIEGIFAAGRTAVLGGVDGDMQNDGMLTLTGKGDANSILVNGKVINAVTGVLNLQNGSITESLSNDKNLTSYGIININGETVVNGDLSNSGYLNVQSGSFLVEGATTLSTGTLRTTSANSGNSINQASAAFLYNLPSGIDGHIIAEQNSYIVLGGVNINTAINIFAESNHDWGTGVTAALFIAAPQTLASTGSIKIDGKSTVIGAASANEVSFASNSLLVVDAQGLGSDAAITSLKGKLTVDSAAKLHITNVKNNQIINIVTGFTGAGGSIASDAWEGDNLTSSSGVQSVKVADFNTTDGSYSVEVYAAGVDGILKNFNQMQVKTAKILAGVSPDVNSADIPTQFLSRATDSGYIGTNDSKKAAATIEGMAQTAGILGVGATTLDVAKTVAGVIASKLGSISQNAAKNMPSGDDNRLQGLSPWVMPLYNYTSVNGYDTGKLESDYETSFGGVAFGADKAVDDYRIGIAFNAGMGSTDAQGDFDGNNEFDFYGASIYGSKNVDDIKITADAGLTYTNNNLKQYLGALSMSDAKADVNSYALSIGAMAEKAFGACNYTYTPYLGVRFTSIYTQNYKMKSGSGVISATKSDNQSILQIPVGVVFETQIKDYNNWSLKPKAKAGIIASVGELEASSNTTFAGVDNAKYNMDNVDALVFDGGIGLEMQKDNITVNFGYNLLASPHEYSHSLSANVKWSF